MPVQPPSRQELQRIAEQQFGFSLTDEELETFAAAAPGDARRLHAARRAARRAPAGEVPARRPRPPADGRGEPVERLGVEVLDPRRRGRPARRQARRRQGQHLRRRASRCSTARRSWRATSRARTPPSSRGCSTPAREIVGKTAVPAFCFDGGGVTGYPDPQPTNPHDPAYMCGSSSNGSAAVARHRRGRHGARRRPGRLDPPAGVVERLRRPQADVRPRPLHRHLPDRADDRPRRPDGAHGRRLRADARRARRRGRPRPAPGRRARARRTSTASTAAPRACASASCGRASSIPDVSEADVDAAVRAAAERARRRGRERRGGLGPDAPRRPGDLERDRDRGRDRPDGPRRRVRHEPQGPLHDRPRRLLRPRAADARRRTTRSRSSSRAARRTTCPSATTTTTTPRRRTSGAAWRPRTPRRSSASTCSCCRRRAMKAHADPAAGAPVADVLAAALATSPTRRRSTSPATRRISVPCAILGRPAGRAHARRPPLRRRDGPPRGARVRDGARRAVTGAAGAGRGIARGRVAVRAGSAARCVRGAPLARGDRRCVGGRLGEEAARRRRRGPLRVDRPTLGAHVVHNVRRPPPVARRGCGPNSGRMASTFRPAPGWRPAAPSIPSAPAADVRSLSLPPLFARARTTTSACAAARASRRRGAAAALARRGRTVRGMPALDALRDRLAELADLASLQRLAGWDQRTMMPPGGAPARAQQSATLERLAHDRATADEIGAWLEELDGGDGLGELDADLVRLARRDWERARRSRASSPPTSRWRRPRARPRGSRRARRTTSPPSRPRCGATSSSRARTPRASTTSSIPTTRCSPTTTSASPRRGCARSSPRSPSALTALAAEAAERPAVPPPDASRSTPSGPRSTRSSRASASTPDSWRVDVSPHPFTSWVGPQDTRITTRYVPDAQLESLLAAMHEFGHGLYERQIAAGARAHEPRPRHVDVGRTSRRASCGRTTSGATRRSPR